MKLLKYLFGSIIICILFLTPSCTGDFEDVNRDYVNPKSVEVQFILTEAQKKISDIYIRYGVNENVTSLISQHFSIGQYQQPTQYTFRTGMLNSQFEDYYRALSNLEVIKKIVADDSRVLIKSKNSWSVILTTLRVFSFQSLTDMFGPIPYSQALNIDMYPTPKYDSQKEIYEGLLKELHEVVSLETEPILSDVGSQDVIYGGDITKWKKFANSLMLRLAMRVSTVDPVLSKKYATHALENDGVFLDNSESALFNSGEKSPSGSILYESVFDDSNLGNLMASPVMVEIQGRTNDPRKDMYWEDFDKGSPGYGVDGSVDGFAHINRKYAGHKKYFRGKVNTPVPFIHYAEVEFLLTEAAVRGGYGVNDATTHFNKAVTASIEATASIVDSTLQTNTISDFLAQADVDIDQAADKLNRIAEQKFIALFIQGPEAWSEIRRFDYPAMTPSVLDGTVFPFPKRFTYPQNAQNLNRKNVKLAADLLNGDDTQQTKLWWDTK